MTTRSCDVIRKGCVWGTITCLCDWFFLQLYLVVLYQTIVLHNANFIVSRYLTEQKIGIKTCHKSILCLVLSEFNQFTVNQVCLFFRSNLLWSLEDEQTYNNPILFAPPPPTSAAQKKLFKRELWYHISGLCHKLSNNLVQISRFIVLSETLQIETALSYFGQLLYLYEHRLFLKISFEV